jgi:DNA-binding transcriptional MocR family regulator
MLPGPDARRLAVGMAERESTVLMDDRSLTALWFDRPPPAALAAHEPASPHLITVGSLSRWTWTGLRIGWVRAPKPVIKRIARIKAHEDVGCSIADQVIAVRLLDRAEEIAGARRAVISTRYRRACELLTTHLPDWKWDPPAGGYSMWVRLPRTTTSGELARAARLRGVLIMPGTANAPSGAGTHAFRLSFGVHPDDLERGITRLGEVWAALCEARRGPSAASTPRK